MPNVITPCSLDELTQGEKYLLERKLKKILPDSSYVYVQPTVNGVRPDFLVFDKGFGIIIIEVKDWSDDYILSVTKKEVLVSDGKRLRNPIKQVTKYQDIITNNIESVDEFLDMDGECIIPIHSAIFFHNLSEDKISELGLVFSHKKVKIYNKDMVRKLTYEHLTDYLYPDIGDKEIDALRGAVLPEITLPRKAEIKNDVLLSLSEIRVLDKEQEDFAKRIPMGHYMVSGLPGSGKTVILLTRAIHLAIENKDWEILIVTYTNALCDKIREQLFSKIKEIRSDVEIATRIKVSTFHGLCNEIIGKPPVPQGMSNIEYYNDYWPKKAIEGLKSGSESCCYNNILIDEYQDFHVKWFELVKKCCVKYNGSENIFLAGDRLQRIYEVPWDSYKEIGINIQGRSKLLKKTYRTNQNHMDIALKFLSNEASFKKDISDFYELENLNEISSLGDEIELCLGGSSIINEKIYDLIYKKGISVNDILVLTHSEGEAKDLVRIMSQEIQDISVFSKKPVPDKIIFTTYHSAKGLESKYCILHSFDRYKKEEKIKRILMYVGMTRASEKLIIHAKDNKGFFQELSDIDYQDYGSIKLKNKTNGEIALICNNTGYEALFRLENIELKLINIDDNVIGCLNIYDSINEENKLSFIGVDVGGISEEYGGLCICC